MNDVADQIEEAERLLKSKGVERSRLHAEWLLAHVLDMPRLHLYLEPRRRLTPEECSRYRELIGRRIAREPLQHLLGDVNFCGLSVAVNKHVLIPRPETEQLALLARDWLQKRAPAGRVIDMGTGSGCIALFLAHSIPGLRILASDLSLRALETAASNARSLGLRNHIQFIRMDCLSGLSETGALDLIVSNPPYIPTHAIQSLCPEVKDYDPKMALDGGGDGLDFYRRLETQGFSRLRPGGRLFLEIGDHQAAALLGLFSHPKWMDAGTLQDLGGMDRFFTTAKRPEPSNGF